MDALMKNRLESWILNLTAVVPDGQRVSSSLVLLGEGRFQVMFRTRILGKELVATSEGDHVIQVIDEAGHCLRRQIYNRRKVREKARYRNSFCLPNSEAA